MEILIQQIKGSYDSLVYYYLYMFGTLIAILNQPLELEDKDQKTLNVWITDIIREDLEKYLLHEEQTYIMPLGDTISKENGYSYHDFTILEDKE